MLLIPLTHQTTKIVELIEVENSMVARIGLYVGNG